MARSFNGTTDFIDCGTGVNWPSDKLYISCWVNFSAFTNAYNTVVGPDDGTNFYQLHVKSTGKLAVYVAASGATVFIDPSTTGISLNTWNHLLYFYNTSVGNLKLFINGVEDATNSATNGTILHGAHPNFIIGKDANNAGRFITASVADITQWSGITMTLGEIQALANGARPFSIRPSNIDGYWTLTGIQSPEPDLSGNAHNGTLTGTTNAASGPPLMQFTPRWPQNSLSVTSSSTGTSFQPAWAMRQRIVVDGIGI